MGLTDEELKARMMVGAEAAIDKLLAQRRPFGGNTLTEIEQLVLAARQAVGEGMTRALVEASGGEQQVPEPVCPECGQAMHYKGVKEKRIISETGEVTVRRAYYYCQTCKTGLFPPG
jgi:hypothetical protein